MGLATTRLVLLLAIWLPACCAAQAEDPVTAVEFDTHIAPILVSHCLECHAGSDPEGGLNLAEALRAREGGDSGPAIDPRGASHSLLWERVAADEMPPEHPLNEHDKELLQQWLDAGGEWGSSPVDRFAYSTSTRAGRDWWALQPLQQVTPPAVEPASWVHNPVDAFILKRLQDAQLNASPQADPRTLVRRLYFDLIGLPPTPEQVAAFVEDPSTEAYEQIVDDLLDSKHYGERWGRHWLDVVRFGESDGFERNFPREHAWPYRDWVIEALNQDMPYDEFVRQQLIGDQLTGGIAGAASTGFWTAGVHNTVVGGSQRMKQLARQDEIEDVLATVGQTFVGLTINCARCHDHKYDPVTQQEFYQLASAISGLGYGERVETSQPHAERLAEITEQLTVLQTQLSKLAGTARSALLAARRQTAPTLPIDAVAPVDATEAATPLAQWEFEGDLRDSRGELHGQPHGNARVEEGALILDGESFVQTPALPDSIGEKSLEVWVQLDNLDQAGGAAISLQTRDGNVFDAIVFGERDPKQWMSGSNGFVRTATFNGSEETTAVERPVHLALVYQADGTIVAYRDGIPYGTPIRKSALASYPAGEAEILFGLRHKPPGGNRFLKARLWRAALHARALSAEEVAASAHNAPEYVSETQIVEWFDESQRRQWLDWQAKIAELSQAREALDQQARRKIYTLTPRAGETTRVLLRGDPDLADEVVAPAAIAAIRGLPGDFGLTPDAPEAERRKQLAQWITHDANPLFARVIVNRIWHYHFGVGIVDTPNDFGFNGGRPTHPELLEFLAWQFRAGGYRMKPLHRMIVTSNTYRQTAVDIPDAQRQAAEAQDADNRLLWRGTVRRLEAESLRDALLSVAGKLNPAMGGPSFRDVSVIENNGTTYYEPIDATGEEFWRRTVYRFNPRGGRSALLDTFDCPDPAAAAPRRAVTTTPLQALSLLNNVFVLRMAEQMALRVESEAGDDPSDQVARAWQLAIARDPTENERRLSAQLVQQHGLAALCRGLFNFNEFVMH